MSDDMSDSDAEVTYSSEHIHQLLRCAVCLDRYNNPKLLPCQHTFCEAPCLEGLVHRLTHTLKCPECRTEHVVPFRGVSAYPNNLTIIGFLSLPKQEFNARTIPLSSNVLADFGGDTNGSDNNRTQRATSSNFSEPRPSSSGQRASGCAVCRSQNSLCRCPHCDQIICDPCRRAHMDQVGTDVNRIVSQIRRGMPHVSNTISIIEQKSEQLRQRAEAAKSDITETIERYIMELRGRQRLLHSEVEMFLLGELRSLRIFQETLEVELASMASFCDSTESMLTRSNRNVPDEDIVGIKRQCVEHMENLRAYETGSVRMPAERHLQFIIEGNRFSNSIANFGEIVTSSSPMASEGHSPRDASPASMNGNADIDDMQPPPESAQDLVETDNNTSMDFLSVPPNVSMSNTVPREHAVTLPASLSWNYIRNYQRRYGDLQREGNVPDYGEVSSSPPSRAPPPRRNTQERRRQHYSDTRLPALMASGFTLSSARSSGTPPMRRDSGSGMGASRQHDHDSYTASPRSTRRLLTHGNQSRAIEIPSSNVSRTVLVGSPNMHAQRSPVRFDVTVEEEEDLEPNEITVLNNHVGPFDAGESSVVSTAAFNYQDKGRARIRFGQRGSCTSQFTWPRGVAVSQRDNTICIADSSNHRVQIFDQEGRFMKSFGSFGVEAGEFNSLSGVTTDNFGQIVICDRYNHRIQIFDNQGNFQSMFGEEGRGDGQLFYPWGVACDGMGFIYVCDKENHRVVVFQSNGAYVRKFGRKGSASGQLENPHYLAISPDNTKVYISDSSNHRIQVFSIYGDFLFCFGSQGTMQGQMKYPKGLAVDGQGFVIVADSGNNRIIVFRGDGRFYCTFGSYGSENGQFKGLEGIGVLANGNLVVMDRENHTVQIF